jgi:hypothetical protein
VPLPLRFGSPRAHRRALRSLTPLAAFAAAFAGAAIAACSAGKGDSQGNTTKPDGSVTGDDAGFMAEVGLGDVDTTKPPPTPQTVIAPGAPADAPSKFGGKADASRNPSIVYPADGVLVPPNMGTLEFHFMPGTGNSLFEIDFESADVSLKVYATCTPVGGGCVYSPDDKTFKLLANAASGGDVVTYKIRGVDGASPGAVGISGAQKISFAEENLTGGLYYWNAGAGATMRYEFGVSGKKGELFLNGATAGTNGACIGCHELSRKGDKIVEGYGMPQFGTYNAYDVATKAADFKKSAGGNFFAWSPTGDRLLASDGSTMVLLDGTTGAKIAGVGTQAGPVTWSPDGATIVYAKDQVALPFPVGKAGVSQGSLETLRWDGTTVNKGTTLVPYAGQNNYYPAFSPDSNLVAFNRSPSNQSSYDAPDALVYVVKADGTGAPIQLSNASPSMGRGDSWPKWTPTVQQHRGHPLFWITFSSRRAYGLRLNTAPPANPGDGTAQIWMAAVDPTQVAAGKDPSFPAFRLPFQDIASGNHIAQWVLTVSRKPCKTVTDCAGDEACSSGLCVPAIQ